MNTKGIKFLAVLAVLAMAFAAFAVISTEDGSDAGIPAGAILVSDINTQEFEAGGNYYITAKQTLTKDVDLNGSTLYVGSYTSSDQQPLIISGGWTLKNGTIDGIKDSGVAACTLVIWGGTVEDVVFKNYNRAIDTNPTVDSYITDCTFNGGGFSEIYATHGNSSGQKLTVSGCTFNSGIIVYDKNAVNCVPIVLSDNDGEVDISLGSYTNGVDVVSVGKNTGDIQIDDTIVLSICTMKGYSYKDVTLNISGLELNNIEYIGALNVAETEPAVANAVNVEDCSMTITSEDPCINAEEITVIDSYVLLKNSEDDTEFSILGDAVLSKFDMDAALFVQDSDFDAALSYTDENQKENSMFGTFKVGESLSVEPGSLSINGDIVSGDVLTEEYSIIVSGDAIYLQGSFTDVDIVIDDDTVVTLQDDVTLGGSSTMSVGSTSSLDIGEYSLAIEENATLVVEGTVTSDENGAIENNGTIEVTPDAEIDADIEGEGEVVPIPEPGTEELGIEGTLDADFTINTSAYLAGDLTIPEGITLYVNGVLKMTSKDLIVQGNLVVGKKGTITTSINDATIYLTKTGTITNNGIIGNDTNANIAMFGEGTYGSAIIKNVTGIQFAVSKFINDGVKYCLTVSGDVSKVKGSTSYYIYLADSLIDGLNIKDVDEVTITDSVLAKNATFVVGSKAEVVFDEYESDYGLYMLSGSSLEVIGSTEGTVYLTNGATVAVNGNVSDTTFSAKTAKYETYKGDDRQDPEKVIDITTTIEIDNLKGVTVFVTSDTYYDYDFVSWTEQMLCISGEASFVDATAVSPEGEISVTAEDADGTGYGALPGAVYVPSGASLVLPSGSSIDGNAGETTSAVIIAQGIISTFDAIEYYYGSEYSIEYTAEGIPYSVYYYTTFDNAYNFLDVCEDKTINLKGGYEFTGDYVIGADESIIFKDYMDYTIAFDATITVLEDGLIQTYVTSAEAEVGFTDIQGILYVELGGYCIPAPASYTVSAKDDEGNMMYTGIARALADAEAGDSITLAQSATVYTLLTIPYGVTLDVAPGVTLTANKGLTVSGVLNNKGTVAVDGGNLSVSGLFDNTEGTTTVATSAAETYEATMTGIFVGDITVDSGIINAAKYTNSESKTVYTSVALATLAVSLMDIPSAITVTGTVTEAADVILTDNMIMTIDGKVKLTSITVMAGAVLKAGSNIDLTATIYGDIGDILGTVPSVSVSGYKAAAAPGNAYIFKTTYSEAYGTYTTSMSAFTVGTVTVDSGSITYTGAGQAVTSTQVLKVSSGATIVTSEAVAFSASSGNSKYFTLSGIMYMKNGGSIDNLTIAGTVYVPAGESVTLDKATVTGNVILEDATSTADPAYATISNYLIVGTAAKTLGADAYIAGDIRVGNTYVIVYGTSVFDPIDTEIVNTTFSINGVLFATVYGKSTTAFEGSLAAINTKVADLEDAGYVIPPTITWMSGTTKITTDTKIGSKAAATLSLDYKTVPVTYSIEPGVYVYVDGLMVTDTSANLAVGTHTIKTYLMPDYQGDIVVKFNGTVLPVTATGLVLNLTVEMQDTTNVLSVSGAEPIPEPEPTPAPTPEEKSEWTVTTILLCVLVVLIAIMAVIVALRLNRN